MKVYTGIPVSEGIAIGRVLVYQDTWLTEIPRYSIKKTEIISEWERLKRAAAMAVAEIKSLYDQASRETSREQADIFQAHIMMLEDPDFLDQLMDGLNFRLQNIEWIVHETAQGFSRKLLASPDPVFRERAVDITDVSRRIINHLLGLSRSRFSLAGISSDVILAAHDLMPSDAMAMNKTHVKGLALDEGSRTCHTAILTRAFNIPAVLGLSVFSEEVKDGDMLVVNGCTGSVILNPDEQTLALEKDKEKQYRRHSSRLLVDRDLPAQTIDGCRAAINANIEFPEEAEQALRSGAEGIGLYRSEFLFITPGISADEETQYRAYSLVLKIMGERPVTIRTMDLGGDKVFPEHRKSDEKNPLLGWRAIRLALANPELFKVQLRAILRASVEGNARIMFPMISGIEELEQALALLDEARAECKEKKQPFAQTIEVGTMIEIPSAAVTADILAEKAGFFSLGTNDLIQYTLAVDRGNEKVNYLGDAFHPAVVRLIKQIIDAAHKKGIKAAMCGELAGNPDATELLLGLGLDEFSMAASSIPHIKQIIRGTTLESCKALADECLAGRSIQEIRAAIKNRAAKP
jgi:phosphotransferase system enzyme I (PtsI)